jgi:hypothetical protein
MAEVTANMRPNGFQFFLVEQLERKRLNKDQRADRARTTKVKEIRQERGFKEFLSCLPAREGVSASLSHPENAVFKDVPVAEERLHISVTVRESDALADTYRKKLEKSVKAALAEMVVLSMGDPLTMPDIEAIKAQA